MQVVRKKCFLLNPEKNLAQIRLVVFEKIEKNASLIPKNDVTEPKARLLKEPVKKLLTSSRTVLSFGSHDFRKPETVLTV